MSEFDLFGQEIIEEKKVAKKTTPVVVAPQLRVNVTVHRPCTVVKTGRNEVMVINSDCDHMFR